jgi:hypothetical protein
MCLQCRKRQSILWRSHDENQKVLCNYCGSKDLQRIMSRFAAPKSEDDRLESMADPGRWSGLDESNGASVAKFVKKFGGELGDEVSKAEIEQMADEAAQEAESGAEPGAGNGGEGRPDNGG